jgi:hypothetical protein
MMSIPTARVRCTPGAGAHLLRKHVPTRYATRRLTRCASRCPRRSSQSPPWRKCRCMHRREPLHPWKPQYPWKPRYPWNHGCPMRSRCCSGKPSESDGLQGSLAEMGVMPFSSCTGWSTTGLPYPKHVSRGAADPMQWRHQRHGKIGSPAANTRTDHMQISLQQVSPHCGGACQPCCVMES